MEAYIKQAICYHPSREAGQPNRCCGCPVQTEERMLLAWEKLDELKVRDEVKMAGNKTLITAALLEQLLKNHTQEVLVSCISNL